MLTCPCNVYPYTPLLYSKTGVYRGLQYFLIFAQNIDCGDTLEPPQISSFSSENFRFYSREKTLNIAWACFRNGTDHVPIYGIKHSDKIQLLVLACATVAKNISENDICFRNLP